MNTRATLIASSLIAAGLVSGAAQAALFDRGGGLIYDDVLNVTWLQDANYAKTQYINSGETLGDADGRMTWADATTWADNLSYFDSVRNVTYDDWRLPTTTDTGAAGCNFAYSGTDCGYNVDPASSEMAHLYFTELGNTDSFFGPFINFQYYVYWSGTEYAPSPSDAWYFITDAAYQGNGYKTGSFYALAVRPGDVAAVPEAQTYALMLAGLGLIGWRARRRG